MSPDTEKICHLLAFVWILYESFLMKFLENLVSSLGFHQPKKKKQAVSVLDHWNRKDKACSFLGSGVLPPIRKLLAFIARKAAKEGKGLRSWSHLFFWCHFVLTKSSTSFSDFIFFWAWLFVFISKNLQYWQIFACCIGVRFLQTSCECGCAQPYGDQLIPVEYFERLQFQTSQQKVRCFQAMSSKNTYTSD